MSFQCDSIREDLVSVLDERDRLFPQRTSQNDVAMHRCLDLYVKCLDDLEDRKDWEPEESLTGIAVKMMENSVFLCGPMKSGTTLLLELLDGHSELNVLPGDSWLWVRFSEKAKIGDFTNKGWRQHWLKRFINPTGQKPFWIFGEDEEAYITFLNYMDYWLDNLPESYRRPISATVCSYFCSNPKRSLNATKWVEKTPGNEFRVHSLDANFPKAKFVHIVRDPRENFASIKRLYRSREWSWDIRGIAKSLADSYAVAATNREKIGKKRYLIMRYEQLTAEPEVSMKKIVSFLGVEWKASLLVPTVNSCFARANTMYKDRQVIGTIRRSVNDKWRQELSFYEQGVIHQTRNNAEKVGYAWPMTMSDHCKRLLFAWTLTKITQ